MKPKKVQTPGSYHRVKKKNDKEKNDKEKKRRREKKKQGEDKQTPKKGKRKAGRPSLVTRKSSSRKDNYLTRYVLYHYIP
jgi:hypothetical protein